MENKPRNFVKTISCYLMASFYMGAGINHFMNPSFYLRVMPEWMPAPELLVAVSGAAEIMLGAALLVRKWRHYAARLIIAMLLVFFVVHVDMMIHYERFEEISYTFLVIRLLLQFVLIAWAAVYARAPRRAEAE